MKRWQKITGSILIVLLIILHIGAGMDLTLYEKYNMQHHFTSEALNYDLFIEEIISYFSIYEILLTVDCCTIVFLFICLWRKNRMCNET